MRVIVNEGGVIDDGTVVHYPGCEVELDDSAAEKLIEAGKVSPKEHTIDGDLHLVLDQDEVFNAIGTLPPDDQTLWTKSGAPTTEALSAAVGKRIGSEQRDAFWNAWQHERGK